MPGFGHSDKPEDLLYNDDTFDRTLLEFFDAVGLDSAILLGNSLGGAISLRFVLDHPTRVNGLILMAPGGVEDRETYFQMTGVQTMVQTFQSGPMDLAAMRRVMSLQMFNPDRIPAGLLEQRVEVAKLQPSTLFSTMRVANMTPRLADIQCPILGFWGVNDQFNPHTGALRITQACPNVRFVLLSQCGHWVMLEHQTVFERECLEFVREVASR
jgi:4,5:9,10-diseco-3-hydroxy-5,9,17-trioxoandrosta-1(10),2-diene-4-oate hydrolase